jgi:hypothetical protein
MRPYAAKPPPNRNRAQGMELVLRFEGAPWTVAFSPGIERFIGAYVRVEGLECEGELLEFRQVVLPS